MEIYYTRRFNRNVGGRDMSRFLLMRVLGEYGGLSDKTEINEEKRGRRYIDGKYGIRFSITHTENYWLCSMSDYEHGIDAEKITRQVTDPCRIAGRFLTEKEQSYIREGRDAAEMRERMVCLWTRKEAYLKFTGEGLYGLGRSPSVIDPPEGTELWTFREDGLYVSVCAGSGSLKRRPDFLCLDR